MGNLTMIATKTIAMIAAAISVLGAVTSTTAFAQNISMTDNDVTSQAIEIRQSQSAANFANAGNVGGSGDNPAVAGNNAVAASFQNQAATASNSNTDNDVFSVTP